MTDTTENFPDTVADCAALFGFEPPWQVSAFRVPEAHVPEYDPDYQFDAEVTLALLMGFAHNRRVYLHGPHGSGKSSQIEQIAARLNWPCVRVNLDGHVTRADLIGRDMVVVRDGLQVTEFVPGILVWALERPGRSASPRWLRGWKIAAESRSGRTFGLPRVYSSFSCQTLPGIKSNRGVPLPLIQFGAATRPVFAPFCWARHWGLC